MYADIIVDISQEQLDKTFQYRIPPELENEVRIGVMVQIPFGRGNRLLTGYVIGIGSTPKIPAEKIKDIDSVSQSGIQAVGRMIQLAACFKNGASGKGKSATERKKDSAPCRIKGKSGRISGTV